MDALYCHVEGTPIPGPGDYTVTMTHADGPVIWIDASDMATSDEQAFERTSNASMDAIGRSLRRRKRRRADG